MVRLIIAEIKKMRRSTMFGISFAGAAVTPVVSFTGFMVHRSRYPGELLPAESLFSETALYMTLLIGTPLFGVLSSWLFNREFEERTIRNILSIPVSRPALFASKSVVLFFWMMILFAWAFALTLALGALGDFSGISPSLVGRYALRFFAFGVLLFFLMGPMVFATFAFRAYVPVIVFAVSVTLVSVVVGNTQYGALYPWTAIIPIVVRSGASEYPSYVPWLSFSLASLCGYAAAFLKFDRMDIP